MGFEIMIVWKEKAKRTSALLACRLLPLPLLDFGILGSPPQAQAPTRPHKASN